MSKLDDLIQKYCPNGVEYKEVKDVCNISKGVQFNKRDMNKIGTFPVINGGILPSGYIERYNQEKNTITISQGGASAGYVNWQNQKFWAGAHCYSVKALSNIVDRYLYHFLKMKEYILQRRQYGAGIPSLSKSIIENLLIPVPPLSVQEEIVRILDSFTKLNEELNEELTKRKNQYEYYRDNLLSFKDKSIYLPLEQILKIKNGKDYKHLNIGKIPVYGTGGIITYVDKYTYNKPSVLIPRKGSLEKLYYLDTPFWNVDTVFYTEIFNNVVEKYVFYCLQKEHLEKLNTAGGVPSLTQRVLNKVRIPVPSLDKQKYIVSTYCAS